MKPRYRLKLVVELDLPPRARPWDAIRFVTYALRRVEINWNSPMADLYRNSIAIALAEPSKVLSQYPEGDASASEED